MKGPDESDGGQEAAKNPNWLPPDLSPEGWLTSQLHGRDSSPEGPASWASARPTIILLGLQMEKTSGCQRWFESLLRPRRVTFTEFWCESPQARGPSPQRQCDPAYTPLASPACRAIESSLHLRGRNGILSGIPGTGELICSLPPAAPDKECSLCAAVSKTMPGPHPSCCHGITPESPASSRIRWRTFCPRITNSSKIR